MDLGQLVRAPGRPIARLLDALIDPARCGRTALTVFAIYAALWATYGVIAKSSQDLHVDMTELVSWAREPALGYPKHPPLPAMIVKLWFAIFPCADWAYYLLAVAVATLTLWIAWQLAGDYLQGEKRVAALALLMLVPFFNVHALKFNVNTALMPLWAATTLWFLRSYERRSALYALLAGIGAGAAMLGKYWSIFLLVGLVLAALRDPRRGAYFRSAAPYLTVAAGTVVVAPHVGWLFAHHFPSFSYALAEHSADGYVSTALAALGYLAGGLGYVALPVLLVLLCARPARTCLTDILIPAAAERRLAAVAFWTALLVPAAVAIVLCVKINSLWTMSAWALLPVVLLSAPALAVTRRVTAPLATCAMALPLLMIAAAPFAAVTIHAASLRPGQEHARLLAAEVERLWRQTSAQPLRLVGGPDDLAYGVAFYAPDRPSAYPGLRQAEAPWVNEARICRDGVALVCPATDDACVQRIEALVRDRPGVRQTETALVRTFHGTAGARGRYVIVAVPPASDVFREPCPAGSISNDPGHSAADLQDNPSLRLPAEKPAASASGL